MVKLFGGWQSLKMVTQLAVGHVQHLHQGPLRQEVPEGREDHEDVVHCQLRRSSGTLHGLQLDQWCRNSLPLLLRNLLSNFSNRKAEELVQEGVDGGQQLRRGGRPQQCLGGVSEPSALLALRHTPGLKESCFTLRFRFN